MLLVILRANEHAVNLSAELAIIRTDKAVSNARNFADKVGVDCELKEPRKRKVPSRLQVQDDHSSPATDTVSELSAVASKRAEY